MLIRRHSNAEAVPLLVLALLLLAGLSCGGGGEGPSRTDRAGETVHQGPNLLLVTIDTLRADRLGCYGYAPGATPVLDRLARKGLQFARVSAPTPVTLPSHSTILTGAFPPAHGVRSNGMFVLAEGRHTLPELLGRAGYRTAAFVSAFVLDSRFGLDQGFELYDDEMPDRDALSRFGFMAERRGADTCDRLIRWLEEQYDPLQNRERPFFVWLHLFDPHQDYLPPEPWKGRHEVEPYDGEIAYADHQLGRVLATLRHLGLDENTLVAAVADHGQSLGEHGESSHGLFIYESAVRVPLIIYAGKEAAAGQLLPAGRLSRRTARLADLAPTLLELLFPEGLPETLAGLTSQIQGESLLARLDPEAGGGALENTEEYLETWYPRYNYGWSELAALVSGEHKYIAAPEPELYDLSADPAELHNLLAEDGEAAALADRLDRRLSELLTELAGDGAGPAAEVQRVDRETRARLLALGYLTDSGTPETADDQRERPDPKRMVKVQEKLFLGSTLTQAGRYEEAIAVYREVVAQSPDSPNALFKLAFVEQTLGRYDDAVEHYQRGLAFHPGSDESQYNLGVCRMYQERYEEAAAALSRAVSLAPDNALFLVDYGEALFRLDLLDKSASLFRRAAELDPGMTRAHFNLGLVSLRRADLHQAETSFRRTLELDETQREARFHLAGVFLAGGRAAEAESQFRRLLDLDPAHAEAHFGLATALDQQNRAAEARLLYQRYLDLCPDGRGAATARTRLESLR